MQPSRLHDELSGAEAGRLAGIMGYADLAMVELSISEPARAHIEAVKKAVKKVAPKKAPAKKAPVKKVAPKKAAPKKAAPKKAAPKKAVAKKKR